MKIKILAVVAILFVGISLQAQKKDKESLGSIKYVQYPEKPLPVEYKTYKVIAKSSYSDPYRRDEMMSLVSLAGYEKIGAEGEEADMVIEVEEYPRKTSDRESHTRNTKVKKDGVEKTVTTYYYTNSFVYKYKYVLKGKEGVIYEDVYEGKNGVTGKDGKNYEEARANYNKAMEKAKNDILSSGVSALNKKANDIYAFPVKSVYLYAYKVKAKKFMYDEFNSAWDKIDASVKESNSSNQEVANFEGDLSNAIEAYKKELEQLDVNNKKARVNIGVGAAAYYNICLSYFLMKQYDKALESLSKGRELEKGIGNASIMESILTTMSSRSKTYSDHIAK